MSQQRKCLRLNNHQPNFTSLFTTFLNTQTLGDVTLIADGKQLLAHKVVLSACSTYFQSLFVDNPSPHSTVILKDVTYADLRLIVDLMYCGEVNVTEEQLPKVLDAANFLKIKGLTEMPDSTSLTRSQGTSAEFQNQGDSLDSQRHSPAASASSERKRKSSTGSTSLNMATNEKADVTNNPQRPTVETITLSSVSNHEIRTNDNSQQTTEPQNLNAEQVDMEAAPAAIAQDADVNYGQGLGVPGPSPGTSRIDVQVAQEPNPQPPAKRRRTINPPSTRNFQRALAAVRFGVLGFNEAAQIFEVSKSTLWYEYKKMGNSIDRSRVKSRFKTHIKLERTQPLPVIEEEQPQPEQQMALL